MDRKSKPPSCIQTDEGSFIIKAELPFGHVVLRTSHQNFLKAFLALVGCVDLTDIADGNNHPCKGFGAGWRRGMSKQKIGGTKDARKTKRSTEKRKLTTEGQVVSKRRISWDELAKVKKDLAPLEQSPDRTRTPFVGVESLQVGT